MTAAQSTVSWKKSQWLSGLLVMATVALVLAVIAVALTPPPVVAPSRVTRAGSGPAVTIPTTERPNVQHVRKHVSVPYQLKNQTRHPGGPFRAQ